MFLFQKNIENKFEKGYNTNIKADMFIKGDKMKESLGKYIVDLRDKNTDIKTSRIMAQKLNITSQYMYDIEKDNRVPSSKLLKKIEELVVSMPEERNRLYDLASCSYKDKKVPADIAKFIIENDEVKQKIREMMKDYNM